MRRDDKAVDLPQEEKDRILLEATEEAVMAVRARHPSWGGPLQPWEKTIWDDNEVE